MDLGKKTQYSFLQGLKVNIDKSIFLGLVVVFIIVYLLKDSI